MAKLPFMIAKICNKFFDRKFSENSSKFGNTGVPNFKRLHLITTADNVYFLCSVINVLRKKWINLSLLCNHTFLNHKYLFSGCRSHVWSDSRLRWETTFGKEQQCSLSDRPVWGHEVRSICSCSLLSGWASFLHTKGRQGRGRKGGRFWWAGRRRSRRRLASPNQVSPWNDNAANRKVPLSQHQIQSEQGGVKYFP